MILFAAGMVTGAVITVVVGMMFAARDADDRARQLQQDELRRIRIRTRPNRGKIETHYEGNR